ncbi:MAG: DUF3891 family protein [Terriglobales bacterium]
MILRALSPPPASTVIEPIWTAIERSQRQDFSPGCWLVPQPAHAALSGDIAANLDEQAFAPITPEVARAFALHDAGWSLDDAAVIQDSRARGVKAKPYSFVAANPRNIAAAWTGSIAIAGKASPLGGYLVSRHFAAIGRHHRSQVDAPTGKILDDFLAQEHPRQQKLRKKLPQADSELDRLLAALQFCDLLSLYLSCGLGGDVEFPQMVAGQAIQLRRVSHGVRLSPHPFAQGQSFSVAAIRHPKIGLESSTTFTLTCVV